jgi:hypothetical protein
MFLNNLIRGEQLGKSSSVYLFLEINKCAHALCTNDALGAQLVPVVTRYRVIYSTGDSWNASTDAAPAPLNFVIL